MASAVTTLSAAASSSQDSSLPFTTRPPINRAVVRHPGWTATGHGLTVGYHTSVAGEAPGVMKRGRRFTSRPIRKSRGCRLPSGCSPSDEQAMMAFAIACDRGLGSQLIVVGVAETVGMDLAGRPWRFPATGQVTVPGRGADCVWGQARGWPGSTALPRVGHKDSSRFSQVEWACWGRRSHQRYGKLAG